MAQKAWDVSGWRIYYQVAIEQRWFNITGQTAIESVFNSDFAEFVERIAILNSKI